jgi:transposase-like protein
MSRAEASLIYRVSSRTARATQRNPVSKKQNKKLIYFYIVPYGIYL